MDGSTRETVGVPAGSHPLLEMFERLARVYGPQDGWWPAESAFEVAVGAVLTQATAWRNAQMAISELKRRGLLTAAVIRGMAQEDVADVIKPAGFQQRKALTLKGLSEMLAEFGDDLSGAEGVDTCSLRRRLLAVHGVGEETADAILLYALGRSTFVADGYARRLFSRLGLVPDGWSYAECREYAMSSAPMNAGDWAELHALIVHHGASTCRSAPACKGCPLLGMCPTGQAALSGSTPARRPLR